ncbi:MAG: 2-C-methyl-D-erythritol 4-phosphate cytidylyltransferase [Acidobacteriaceae bacterium]|nr:2-C-methyl-D-erythritol 4-phosphate cytidylyltransferase [Acidobacteriaceae bacterium]
MSVFVIIPAAGLGTRMAAQGGAARRRPSKQFTEIGGIPILVHTLKKFDAVGAVTEIVIALRKPEIEAFTPRLEREHLRKPVRYVEGGEHRQDSVAAALRSVNAAPEDVVLVHDAVRPFVDADIIDNVIEAAVQHGAAIAGLPAVDTVKQVDRTAEGAIVVSTIPRARVVMAQTPQGFRYRVIKKAFDEALADGFVGTDESSLVERSGHEVVVVMGSPRNIKITTPADLELAEFYLAQEDRTPSLAG